MLTAGNLGETLATYKTRSGGMNVSIHRNLATHYRVPHTPSRSFIIFHDLSWCLPADLDSARPQPHHRRYFPKPLAHHLCPASRRHRAPPPASPTAAQLHQPLLPPSAAPASLLFFRSLPPHHPPAPLQVQCEVVCEVVQLGLLCHPVREAAQLVGGVVQEAAAGWTQARGQRGGRGGVEGGGEGVPCMLKRREGVARSNEGFRNWGGRGREGVPGMCRQGRRGGGGGGGARHPQLRITHRYSATPTSPLAPCGLAVFWFTRVRNQPAPPQPSVYPVPLFQLSLQAPHPSFA